VHHRQPQSASSAAAAGAAAADIARGLGGVRCSLLATAISGLRVEPLASVVATSVGMTRSRYAGPLRVTPLP